jgi:ubiquinol-cytochrome c reductase cytochrome c subunit
MRRRVETSILPWLFAAIVGAAIAQTLLAPASSSAQRASESQLAQGMRLFEESCASCHGPAGEGTANGPPLERVGAANVDFMLSTGRMPLANPNLQPQRQPPAFTPEQIRAIVAFVDSFSSGGTDIPAVDVQAGSLSLGQRAYEGNCAACHGAAGTGDSIGGNQIAPGLDRATPLQIAEAIRVGPGPMPRFGTTAVDQRDLDSIVRYLLYLRHAPNRGGLGLTRVGPVVEGFVGVVVGLGLLLLVIRYTGSRE